MYQSISVSVYQCISRSVYHLISRSVDLGLRDICYGRVSMMLTCDADVIIEYDRRRIGLSSAPLDMT